MNHSLVFASGKMHQPEKKVKAPPEGYENTCYPRLLILILFWHQDNKLEYILIIVPDS